MKSGEMASWHKYFFDCGVFSIARRCLGLVSGSRVGENAQVGKHFFPCNADAEKEFYSKLKADYDCSCSMHLETKRN